MAANLNITESSRRFKRIHKLKPTAYLLGRRALLLNNQREANALVQPRSPITGRARASDLNGAGSRCGLTCFGAAAAGCDSSEEANEHCERQSIPRAIILQEAT